MKLGKRQWRPSETNSASGPEVKGFKKSSGKPVSQMQSLMFADKVDIFMIWNSGGTNNLKFFRKRDFRKELPKLC